MAKNELVKSEFFSIEHLNLYHGDEPPPGWLGQYEHEVDDKWYNVVENGFAEEFLRTNHPDILPQQPAFSQLCKDCSEMSSQNFKLMTRHCQLTNSAESCGLCRMLFQCLDWSDPNKQEAIEVFREGSKLRIKGDKLPVLRICIGPGSKASPADIQVGFPILPEAGSPIHFKLLREWLRVCDERHECRPGSDVLLPTRVLDVGDHADSDSLHLYCTKKDERGRYIALSHCWGVLEESQKCCTYRCNFEARCNSIDFDALPKTFRDAVIVTRELGVRFLWIDSLCIIQKDKDDWYRESKKMETVFRSAYCTIAASSAGDSTKGFLSPRSPREYVKVRESSDSPLYICQNIDNFQSQVEEGELSRRGWVLQERALACRTIHFTKDQTYWECGKGVYSESLTKMHNGTARLLGDHRFPNTVMHRGDNEQIRLFEVLFEMYSKLALTNYTDRAIAISGLQSRFASIFNTEGSYGIFRCYLHRSILWQRSGDERMKRIEYPPDLKVPSWSWMAYGGRISYMAINFNEVEWSNAVECFPSITGELELQAPVREFLNCIIEPLDIDDPVNTECGIFSEGIDQIGWLKFDEEDRTDIQRLKCIVVGRSGKGQNTNKQGQKKNKQAQKKNQQEQNTNNREHYILVVVQRFEGGHCIGYERVGVGSIQKRHISFEGGELEARIV